MQTVENYTFEEENLIVQTATERKTELLKYTTEKQNFLKLRSHIIQNYFIRLSIGLRIKFILRLIDKISLTAVIQVMQIIFIGRIKMELYSYIDSSVNFSYDKVFPDHDRMLNRKYLCKNLDNDIAWFATIDEMNQVSLIIDLIRVSAGGTERRLYLPILKMFHEKMRTYSKSQIFQLANINTVELLEYSNDIDDDFDVQHPVSLEVDKQRKRWDDMITKYQIEIDATVQFLKRSLINEGKDNKYEKSANAGPKYLQKDVMHNEIDMLQLMPVWIVKKIFSYFNHKELLLAKQVNDYWDYVIEEILKETKSRNSLALYLDHYKNKINQEHLQQSIAKLRNSVNMKFTKHKLGCEGVGIVSKKLFTKQSRSNAETSLLAEVTKQRDPELQSFSGQLVSFPRIIRIYNGLYRHYPCFLKDTNVRLGIEKDIERQRSVLTYSLTTFTSNLNLNVGEDQLSEW